MACFFPNENAILIKGQGDKWKEWFKVDLIKNDTILFIDSLSFRWKGNDVFVNTLSFSKNGRRLLIGTDKKSYGGILLPQHFLFMI